MFYFAVILFPFRRFPRVYDDDNDDNDHLACERTRNAPTHLVARGLLSFTPTHLLLARNAKRVHCLRRSAKNYVTQQQANEFSCLFFSHSKFASLSGKKQRRRQHTDPDGGLVMEMSAAFTIIIFFGFFPLIFL